MGDMEDNEAQMCARDAELDRYYDWLADFAYQHEARQTLVRWLQFTYTCTPCGHTELVTKRGEHSYEMDCEHVENRETVDDQREYAKTFMRDASQWEQRAHCPWCLVVVTVVDNWRDWPTDEEVMLLSCGHRIDDQPMRLPCYECPKIDGVAVPMPRVLKLGSIVEERRDPTQSYLLECGHVAI